MSDKTYKTLTFIARKVLPALVTLIIGVGELWQMPYYKEIAGTVSLVDAFINAILDKISADYFAEKEASNG